MPVPERWQLRSGETLLATMTVDDDDFPWLHASFSPEPAFEPYRALFVEELEALNALEAETPAVIARNKAAYEAVRAAALTLHYPDGKPVVWHWLHVDGDRAWWRWSDTPVED